MKGERDFDGSFVGETSHYYQQKNMFEGVSSSCYNNNSNNSNNNNNNITTNGLYFSDVVGSSSSSSSSLISNFDQTLLPMSKTHFVDQFYGGVNVKDSCFYRRGNTSGIMVDEVDLAREFQKLDVGNISNNINNNHNINVGQLRDPPEVFRVSNCGNVSENFGVLEGFYNGVSGNGGGFSVKDDRGFRLGQRGGGNFGSNLGYGFDDHSNGLLNFEGGMQGNECFGNGVGLIRGNNKCYDRVPVNDFVRNFSIDRGNEGFGNGGVVSRGDFGYGNEISYQLGSNFVPNGVGEAYMVDGYKEMLSSWANSQMYKHSFDEGLSEQYGWQFQGNLSGLGTSQVMFPKQGGGRENVVFNSMREKMRVVEEREGGNPVTLMKRTRHVDPYGGEKTLIVQEKGLNGGIGRNYHQLGGRTKNLLSGNALNNIGERNFELNVPLQTERGCDNGSHGITDPLILQTLYQSLVEVKGNIYLMAKDQHGCRFLQKKFDEGSFEDVQLIFSEIIDHVVELMMNPFGNYLVQKLLDVCNEEQRMKIVHVVTKDRGELVRISLNTHGTRVVQKLIESLTTRKQISMIIRALDPGFLDLIKDLNGNHVVQRCLQCLSSDDNKFIFDAAAKFCVEIATHRHGCCVLQRCIYYSTGEHRQKLIEQICSHGLVLAQDPFGNYVVQYIIEQKIPSASALLITQFQGNYVHLATQKFSSHVVEKCLKFIEDSHPQIVYEMLSVSQFEQLVQDPYANYVLQSALEVTKGALYESLVSAVRPHSILRTNPYCKKIFSRGLLKK